MPVAARFSAEAGHEYEIRIEYAPQQERMPWYGGNRLWLTSGALILIVPLLAGPVAGTSRARGRGCSAGEDGPTGTS